MVSRSKGFLAVIISGIIFGCMPLLAKNIYASGGNAINLVFWRFFISVPVLYIIIKKIRIYPLVLLKKNLRRYF